LQNGRCPYTAGAAEGISRRVIFTDFSSRMPGKIFRKNSGAIVTWWVRLLSDLT
jgi:hypothetical protein